jgi:TolB-like protein/tetratricopeptide (TPR) repeat protein
MSDTPLPPAPTDVQEKKRRKQAEKARGAWISFAGRIVAQIVGAVASVALGVFVLQKHQQSTAAPETAAASVTASPTRSAGPRRPGEATIAVLPLANLSGNADQEYFADGMTEALTAGLAQVEGLRVISRTSTMRYKQEHPSVPEIARTLGVDLLVEGSVLQAGDQVRITAQLIDGATDEHLWAENYTRTLKDVIALQDAVANAIAAAIKGTVSRRPGTRSAAHVVDPATYDLYLRGRHAWYTRTNDAMQTALTFFEKAAQQDPQFALAHVGIADTYALLGSPSMPLDAGRDRREKARVAATRALDLDPGLAEAHTALAGVLFFGDRDLAGAERVLAHAIELNPSYAVAHVWYAVLLAELGRFDEAVRHADTAVSLDPFEATMHQARGLVLYSSRRDGDAATALRRALELSPALPLARVLLVKTLVMAGKPADALAACGDPAAATSPIDLRIVCAVAAARANRLDDARRIRASLEAMRPVPGAALAQIDGALDRFPEAFQRLGVLAERGALPPVFTSDPLYEALRRQPQWPAIVAAHKAHAQETTAAPAVSR